MPLLLPWACDDLLGAGNYAVKSGGSDATVKKDGGDGSVPDSPVSDTTPGDDVENEAASDDSNCGSLMSTSNCGSCGAVCAQPSVSVQSASCNGTECIYKCAKDYLDCNAAMAPNVDGCECYAPGATVCCSTHCPVQHSNGLGQTFYDCVPQGTYNVTLATDACYVFTLQSHGGICGQGMCQNGDLGVWNFNSAECAGWMYSGIDLGVVHDSFGTSCDCPIQGDPTYQ